MRQLKKIRGVRRSMSGKCPLLLQLSGSFPDRIPRRRSCSLRWMQNNIVTTAKGMQVMAANGPPTAPTRAAVVIGRYGNFEALHMVAPIILFANPRFKIEIK